MGRVYVSIGSNLEPEVHIPSALAELRRRYGALIVSPVYESEAVGFEGDNFYNLVVGFDTDDDVHAVARALREIEHRHQRRRDGKRFGPRTLDLDLLLYDDLVLDGEGVAIPRHDILRYAFVLKPLADIAGERRHPVDGRTYAELWAALARAGTGGLLWPVELPVAEVSECIAN
ncbi:MAG: 2-amino-4-hydroxy-6-hydroxymethyldihydropteridine diphosphokinase [Gammaproteobacteria bacterium]